MQLDINPFHELYVTEKVDPDKFVRIVSPFLISHAQLLFSPGNVILLGGKGSGKSTLLGFLKPEIRREYCKTIEAGFPVPERHQNFIGAGINLLRSDALGIGQRPVLRDASIDEQVFPLYFADFVNYWIVRDLLSSVLLAGEEPRAFRNIVTSKHLDTFALTIAQDDCWFGYMNGVNNFLELCNRLDQRIGEYRAYFQFNKAELSDAVSETKTAIGYPISRTASCLRDSGVLNRDTQVFIRIDQLEQLTHNREIRANLGINLRRIINQAISTRDPAISYKIGVRQYAWRSDLRLFGVEAKIESDRDYKSIDLDQILSRQEDRAGWIFPGFARDVFARRLEFAGLVHCDDDNAKSQLLRKVIGEGESPAELAMRYTHGEAATRAKVHRVLHIEKDWPSHWCRFLERTFRKDPLTAKLIAAWLRQGHPRGGRNSRLDMEIPTSDLPWMRPYWRKERIRQALTQLAADCQQRPVWGGDEQLIAMSTEGILLLVFLCQQIWDAFIRSESNKPAQKRTDPIADGIPINIQSLAIHTASSDWYNKITDLPDGHLRQRFVATLGRSFQAALLADKSMSYPGHNGFSLANDELDENSKVRLFLQAAVDCGALDEAPHTTKNKDRRLRTKWYLNPVFSPYFRIPETHVKEPIYCNVSDVGAAMCDGIQLLAEKKTNDNRAGHGSLHRSGQISMDEVIDEDGPDN